MKNITFRKLGFGILPLIIFTITLLSSCDKEEDAGAPIIESVYALDTVARHRDSTFQAADPYVLLVINGRNIGGVMKAYFNEYQTSFNTTYNTDTKLIIRIPGEAPTDETATNLIRLVTANGEATYKFKILAKASITSFNRINYGEDVGRDITFTGKNFGDMEKVVAYREKDFLTEIVTDSVVCEIVSKTADKLVVRIPSNTLSRVTLNLTNSSGTTRFNDTFVNTDVAFKIFTEDYAPGFGNASWGDGLVINTDEAYSGQKSASKKYAKGNWHLAGMGWGWLPYDPSYKYVTFAIKGGSTNYFLYLTANSMKSEDMGAFVESNKISVLANTWNYYKLPLKDLDFWSSGKQFKAIAFRIKGPDAGDETFYFDDVMLIK